MVDARIGSLSERRIALMMDSHMSRLPPFLVKNGVNSGFMIAQVTAALCAENKALSHPHSVDSLPTSARPGGPRFHGASRRASPVGDGGKYPRRAGS